LLNPTSNTTPLQLSISLEAQVPEVQLTVPPATTAGVKEELSTPLPNHPPQDVEHPPPEIPEPEIKEPSNTLLPQVSWDALMTSLTKSMQLLVLNQHLCPPHQFVISVEVRILYCEKCGKIKSL